MMPPVGEVAFCRYCGQRYTGSEDEHFASCPKNPSIHIEPKTAAQIAKEREEEDAQEAGYRASDYKWFGNSVPPHIRYLCLQCNNVLDLTLENILKGVPPQICPQCKRRSLKLLGTREGDWGKYSQLRLWEFDLFSDQFKTQYAAHCNGSNIKRIIPLRGEEMKGLLALRIKKKSELEDSLMYLSGLCYKAGQTNELHTRIARKDGAVWIDMCDEKWRAIKITPNEGWKIEDSPPTLFRRFDHMKPFLAEEGAKKDLEDFIKLINFAGADGEKKKQQKLLYAGYLSSQFLPDIQTALLMPIGPSGSAKSTMSILTRSVIDPSSINEIVLTQRTELPQNFMQHRLPIFGNCGYISQEQSDMFCNLITGGSIFKRKLFTDSGSVSWTFKHSVILNGLAAPSLAPDLMTRTIKFELEHIPEAFLRSENEVMKEAEELLPRARGYLMQIVADALAGPLPSSKEITRLGDFGRYGDICTTKMGMGWNEGDFLKAIVSTGRENAKEAVEADYIGGALVGILEERNGWEGTSSDLIAALVAAGLDAKNPNFPRTSQRMSDVIYGKLRTGLGLFEWYVSSKRVKGKRIIVISKSQELKNSS